MRKDPRIIEGPSAQVPEDSKPKPWSGGRLRDTRANILAKIDASGLTAAHKAVIVEEIAAIPPEFDLIQVDFHRHQHKGGANWTATATEL
jgi:hypothetical protein